MKNESLEMKQARLAGRVKREKISPLLKKKRQLTAMAKIDPRHSLHRIAVRDAGSVNRFIEFLSYCPPDEDGDIGNLIRAWKTRRNKRVMLDEVLIELGMESGKVYGWAAEGCYRYMNQAKNFLMSKQMSQVLDTHFRVAKTNEGFNDRRMFAQMSGLLPTSTGTKVNVTSTNVNTAQSKSDSESGGLPAFESGRRDIAELVRADD